MSLTSHLKDSNNPIRTFLRTQFPNTRTFLSDARREVRHANTIRQDRDVRWDTVAMALDYRIRYYFAVTPYKDLMAYRGARVLTDAQSISSSLPFDYEWTGDKSDEIVLYDKHTGRTIYTYFPLKHGGWSEDGVGVEKMAAAMTCASRIASGAIAESRDRVAPLKSEYRGFFKSLDSLIELNPPVAAKTSKGRRGRT